MEGGVTKEGWILKRGVVNKAWKRRYLVLTKNLVAMYFKTDKIIGKPQGSISLSRCMNVCFSEQNEDDKISPTDFEIVLDPRVYYLKCETATEATEWVNALREACGMVGDAEEARLRREESLKKPLTFKFGRTKSASENNNDEDDNNDHEEGYVVVPESIKKQKAEKRLSAEVEINQVVESTDQLKARLREEYKREEAEIKEKEDTIEAELRQNEEARRDVRVVELISTMKKTAKEYVPDIQLERKAREEVAAEMKEARTARYEVRKEQQNRRKASFDVKIMKLTKKARKQLDALKAKDAKKGCASCEKEFTRALSRTRCSICNVYTCKTCMQEHQNQHAEYRPPTLWFNGDETIPTLHFHQGSGNPKSPLMITNPGDKPLGIHILIPRDWCTIKPPKRHHYLAPDASVNLTLELNGNKSLVSRGSTNKRLKDLINDVKIQARTMPGNTTDVAAEFDSLEIARTMEFEIKCVLPRPGPRAAKRSHPTGAVTNIDGKVKSPVDAKRRKVLLGIQLSVILVLLLLLQFGTSLLKPLVVSIMTTFLLYMKGNLEVLPAVGGGVAIGLACAFVGI